MRGNTETLYFFCVPFNRIQVKAAVTECLPHSPQKDTVLASSNFNSQPTSELWIITASWLLYTF